MKYIVIEPFQYVMYLTLGEEDFTKTVSKKNLGHFPVAGSCGLVMPLEDINGVAFCLVYLEDEADEGTLWHEALHVVHFMLEARGVPLTVANTEVQTYLQEYVVKLFKKEIERKAKRLVKKAEKEKSK